MVVQNFQCYLKYPKFSHSKLYHLQSQFSTQEIAAGSHPCGHHWTNEPFRSVENFQRGFTGHCFNFSKSLDCAFWFINLHSCHIIISGKKSNFLQFFDLFFLPKGLDVPWTVLREWKRGGDSFCCTMESIQRSQVTSCLYWNLRLYSG